MLRVANLIDELLDDCPAIDRPAACIRLGDDYIPIFTQFCDRIADIRQAVVLPIAAIAAGYLSAALNEVPRHAGRREVVPVVPLPAEFVHGGADGQRSIGDAAGNDEAGAVRQRFGDQASAE